MGSDSTAILSPFPQHLEMGRLKNSLSIRASRKQKTEMTAGQGVGRKWACLSATGIAFGSKQG